MNKVKQLSKCLLSKVNVVSQKDYHQGWIYHICNYNGKFLNKEGKSFLKINKLDKRKDVVIASMFCDFKMGEEITKKGAWKGVLVEFFAEGCNPRERITTNITFYPSTHQTEMSAVVGY